MKAKFGLALVCGVILAVSAAMTLEAQGRGMARKLRKNSGFPELKNSEGRVGRMQGGVPQVAVAFDDPAFDVEVPPDLSLTPVQLALYESMADQISSYADIPTARTNFFSGAGYTLLGWEGNVNDVTAIAGGYRVTVSVVPRLVTGDDTPVSVSSDYSERFDVINNTVTYIDSLDPLGQSGQALPAFEY